MKEYEMTFAGLEGSRRLLLMRLLLRRELPELADALREVVREARSGVRLTLTALKPGQTVGQRGYYHMWKNAFAHFCGNTPDEMHEYLLCETYGSDTIHTRIGMMRRPLHRSSEANRPEYSDLISTLIRVAGDHGFVVPPPLKPTGDFDEDSENDLE